MINNKKSLFSTPDIDISVYAKALSHPARVKILKLLLIKSPQLSLEIVEQLPLSQATVSQHLSELKHSGLLYDRKKGTRVYYHVDKAKINLAFSMFQTLLKGEFVKPTQQKLF
jgi:DNA-binding transcriptional ArsR family regulator